MIRTILFHCLLLAFAAVAVTGCRPQTAAPPSLVLVVPAESVPTDPDDSAWETAPEFVAALVLQDLVEPRLLEPSTTEAKVRAITDGRRLAVRIAWTDTAQDDVSSVGRFTDACAVQFPTVTESTVPAPQMGEVGRPVEITYWSAAWQATVNGRGDTLQDIYPRAHVDHYPFRSRPLEAQPDAQRAMETRYAPARALHNMMAGPRESPVQDLVAEGPGSLTPAAKTVSAGHGQRTDQGWVVVISRPLPAGVSAAVGTQVAFAVWQGDRSEVGSRKMRTGWIPLNLLADPQPSHASRVAMRAHGHN